MCAGAIVQARIPHLVFGATDEKAGAAGTLYNVCQDERLNHCLEITSGVLADESIPRLFLAGVIPGLMQAALLASYIFWYSRRHGYARGEAMPMSERRRRTVSA